jgi:hypothetical protein
MGYHPAPKPVQEMANLEGSGGGSPTVREVQVPFVFSRNASTRDPTPNSTIDAPQIDMMHGPSSVSSVVLKLFFRDWGMEHRRRLSCN